MTSFEVDGTSYTLSFKIGAQKAYQRETNETVAAAFVSFETTPGDMIRISALFRTACSPEVSEEKADALIDAIGIAKAIRLLGEAASEAFADLADPNPKAPPAK